MLDAILVLLLPQGLRFCARCGSLTPLPLWSIAFASVLSRPSLHMGRCQGFLLGHSGVFSRGFFLLWVSYCGCQSYHQVGVLSSCSQPLPIGFVISPLFWGLCTSILHGTSCFGSLSTALWLIWHGVLRTAHRLVITFGMVDVPLACFRSPAVLETLDHLFFYCPLAQSILSWLQALLLRCSALVPSLACRHVLFGFNQDEFLCVPCIFVHMLNVCTFFLWQARKDYRFRDVAPIAADVLAKVRVRVRFYLPLFFKCFLSTRLRRFFVRQWGARGVVASVWWSFGSSLVSSLCCLLVVGPRRFCLALLFHHIARHKPRRVSSRLSFAVSTCLFLCFFLMLVPCVVAWPCFSTSKRAISFVESFPVLCLLLVSA